MRPPFGGSLPASTAMPRTPRSAPGCWDCHPRWSNRRHLGSPGGLLRWTARPYAAAARPATRVHLLAAMDHHTGAVLAQVDVAGKTNETSRFQPLLNDIDLDCTVVTADGMHTQREHAAWLVTAKNAGYIC